MKLFSESGLSKEILDGIKILGFETPTSIQSKVIPLLLDSDQDIIATAQTGTGKTAAFGLPAVEKTNVERRYVQTLILSPTRELCIQITEDLKKYAKFIDGISIVPVYGGASIDTQIRALKRGGHIVVATPGRCKDLINRKRLDLSSVERVILDEADEMLTMGFKDDLDDILSHLPEQKQTLLFSATMSREVISISKNYMKNAHKIEAERVNSGTKNIEHYFYMVPAKFRYETVKRIADLNPKIYGIIFCRTRRETQEVASKLMNDGYNADAIHGDLSQAQRTDIMNKFRKKTIQILVATDVAARGLDVSELTHVINYNLPDETEVYTHRSGRTGRAGNKGISIAIINNREGGKLKAIEKKTGVKFKEEKVPTGKEICAKQLFALIDKVQKTEVNEKQIEPYLEDVYKKLEGFDREGLIKQFVSVEFNRFIKYYNESSDIQSQQDGGNGGRSSNNDYQRFFINQGKEQGLNPARLLGMVNEALDSSSAKVGEIEILNKFSFFEIEISNPDDFIGKMSSTQFDGNRVSIEPAQKKNNSRGGGNRSRDRGRGGERSGGRSGSGGRNSNRSGGRNNRPRRR